MDKKSKEILKTWFHNYVKTYLSCDEVLNRNMLLKKEHSLNVTQEIVNIGRSVNLSQADLNLAEVIGLFHDIGRFKQYQRYQTFVDSKSENHATLGVQVLKRQRILENYDLTTQELIFFAILNHNRFRIDKTDSNRLLQYSKLLRDADKIDIWRIVTDYYYRSSTEHNNAVELDLSNQSKISKTICTDLMAGRIAKFQNMKTLNDFKLLQISWIYDLHFHYTFQVVKERQYLELLVNTLPQIKTVQEIYLMAKSYLDEKCNRSHHSL